MGLCNKQFPLTRRMQLFGATVSATLLYGAGTWTVAARRLRLLRSAQRKMPRSMVTREGRRKRTSGDAEDGEGSEEDEKDSDEDSKEEGQESHEEDGGKGEDLEPWREWVRRVTHTASEKMSTAQVEDWGDAVRRKVWILAGHISRRHDGRWSTTMLDL